jgi:hypothetical protein
MRWCTGGKALGDPVVFEAINQFLKSRALNNQHLLRSFQGAGFA